MNFEILKYCKEWLEFGFITENELISQNLEFKKGSDKNPEHFRYKSFRNWINNNTEFTNIQIDQFLILVDIDPDEVMSSSIVSELYKSQDLSVGQQEKLKNKLLSYGDWAIKVIENKESLFKESFNERFCSALESHLSETFKNSNQLSIRQLWCDGIVCNNFTRKFINDNRKLETLAYIGKDGQSEYKLTILFGKYSLRRYAKQTEMIDCIPSSKEMSWIELDIEKKTMAINLK